MMENNNIRVNDSLTLKIKRLGINGEGIGYFKRLAVFVDGAIPGETVRTVVTEVFNNRLIAKIDKVLEKSSKRVTPFCPIYDLCGGCQTQHFLYDYNLELKRDLILKSYLKYLGKDYAPLVENTIGSQNIVGYRNKASLPVRYVNGKNRFGMYQRNSNQFIPIDDCGVQRPNITKVFKEVMNLLEDNNITVYNLKNKTGDLHALVVRETEYRKEMQVTFVLMKPVNWVKQISDLLVQKFPQIKSVFTSINSNVNNQVFFSKDNKLIYGSDTIEEVLDGKTYLLSNESFFQLNTSQAKRFYETMVQLANLDSNDIVVDAYSGLGPVSQYVSDKVKKVYAIELNKSATISLKKQLKINNIDNVVVINDKFSEGLSKIKDKVDVMFFDPPRSGLDDITLKLVMKREPSKIIYGSCNPSTLAKNLKELLKKYKLIKTVPLDMFPQTSLVESVTLLELRKVS